MERKNLEDVRVFLLILESFTRISVQLFCSTASVCTCCCNTGLKLLVLCCWSSSEVHRWICSNFAFSMLMADNLRTLFFRIWLFCFPPTQLPVWIYSWAAVYLFVFELLPSLSSVFSPVSEEFMRDHIHFTFARLTCLLNFSWEIHSPIHLLLSYSVSPALAWSFPISDAFVLGFILGGNSTFYRDIIFPEMPFSRNIFMALSCWGLIIQLQSMPLLRLLSFLWVNV